MQKFTDFNLNPKIQQGIDAAGFTHCTPVQEETFEALFNGHDVTVKSQTGTGKTAAFLISLFQLLLENPSQDSSERKQVLVLAPTRELVVQIQEEAQVLGSFLDFSFCAVYGGVGYKSQEDQLEKIPDFVFCTPGRLLDFVQSHKINLQSFSYLVIDEADRMFDMGFYPDIQRILKGMKPSTERRTLLFSATLETKVLNIAWNFMNNPANIEIEPENITLEAITQKLFHVSRDEKFSLFLGLIRKYQPDSAIFFTNTKRMAEELSFRLRANDFTAEFVMGDLPQKKRLKIIQSLKQKEIRFLVATDVAARGLHIDDLTMVFNYDLPEDPENYVHRIGRTARAGNLGMAVSIADEHSVYNLAAIEKFINMKIPVEAISSELLAEDNSRKTRFRSDYAKSGTGRQNRNSNRGSGRPARRQSEKPRQPVSKNSPAPKRHSQPRKSVNHPPGPGRTQSGAMNEQERLQYYAQKYGESFTSKTTTKKSPPSSGKIKEQKSQKSQQSQQSKKRVGIFKNIFGKK